MDDGISLRPFATTQRLGPAGNPFAAFSKGAGHQIRAKREDLWEDRPPKKPEELIRYSKDFLETLRQKFTDLPPNVQSYLPCFTTGESSSDQWSSTFQPVVGPDASPAPAETATDTDTRDWRSRPAAQHPPGASPSPSPSPAAARNSNVGKMHKTADAYRPGTVISLDEQQKAIKTIKGVLNKLTPDNFDRLTAQIVQLVTTAEVLRKTISLVFEKAVMEPTFCALYASLCEVLSKELPDFPPWEGETKPLTFRRILLNTCQDEFEGVGEARAKSDAITEPIEKEIAEKGVKNRTLGNVRLIAELYKKGLVMEKIMHNCIKDLLSPGAKEDGLPHEDNMEAACEVITLSGKKLSEAEKYKSNISAYLIRLERFSKNKTLASRIKFMIRDVLDMKANNWTPRRQKFTAKKIEQIRQEAETELGIQIKLPQVQRAKAAGVEEAELFPAPAKFSRDGDWKPVTGRNNRAAPAAASQPEPVAERPKGPNRSLTLEDRKKRAESLYKEFVSSNDKQEALMCAKELAVPDFLDKLIDIGVQILLDSVKEREQAMIVDLIVDFCLQKIFTADELMLGVKVTTDQLEDLSLDIPKSPDLCGLLLGCCIHKGVVGMEALPALCEPIMGGEVRRAFSAAVFQTVQEKGGGGLLEKSCKAANIKASSFLQPKANWDPPDLPSVEDFLNKKGFGVVPL
ncbi:hypothetical protein BSKO_03019 [Bryopsis sp. KO-2023]|nr:hypothetical protein BSKO_03019 [Bryopsis sp. KO-2023]